MRRLFQRFAKDHSGATAIEYGLIAALVALVIITGLTAFAGAGTGVLNRVMTAVSTALSGSAASD